LYTLNGAHVSRAYRISDRSIRLFQELVFEPSSIEVNEDRLDILSATVLAFLLLLSRTVLNVSDTTRLLLFSSFLVLAQLRFPLHGASETLLLVTDR
jgi:hypothetical protein